MQWRHFKEKINFNLSQMEALREKFVVLIGAEDEANDPSKYPEVMQTAGHSSFR
jgi:hypothetical protein